MKKMYGVVAAAVMMVMTAGAQTSATVKDDLFAGTEVFAKNATDINEVTMDPATLGMVDGKDQSKARRTVLSVVRTYSYDKPGMYRIEDVDAFRNKLNTGEWHCSVHTRSLKTGESTDICNKQRSDDLHETAIITVEPKSLTFIHTIRRGGGGNIYTPMGGLDSGTMDPAWRAEMAISMAEMHAQMAEMRAMQPGMLGIAGPVVRLDMPKLRLELDRSLKSLPKLDSPEMQKKTDEAMQQWSDAKKQAAEKQAAEKQGAEKQPE